MWGSSILRRGGPLGAGRCYDPGNIMLHIINCSENIYTVSKVLKLVYTFLFTDINGKYQTNQIAFLINKNTKYTIYLKQNKKPTQMSLPYISLLKEYIQEFRVPLHIVDVIRK